MEAKATWEKSPERVRGALGDPGYWESRDRAAWKIGARPGSAETLNKLERALGPGKGGNRLPVRGCPQDPGGSRGAEG